MNPLVATAQRSRARRPVATAAAVVVIAAAVSVGGGDAPVKQSTPASVAGVELNRLAETIGEVPGDWTAGRYVYHRQWRWIVSDVGRPPRPHELQVHVAELQSWIADDGSGATSHVTPPPSSDLAATSPGYRSVGAEFAGGQRQHAVFSAGSYNAYVVGWVPPEPVALVRYLAAEPLPDAPATTLSAVVHLNLTHFLNRAARIAVLRLLATTPGLTWHADLTDRVGRRGVGISAEIRDGRRQTLVFDTSSGQLLASYTVKTGAGDDLFRLPVGQVTFYTLLGEVGRRGQLP